MSTTDVWGGRTVCTGCANEIRFGERESEEEYPALPDRGEDEEEVNRAVIVVFGLCLLIWLVAFSLWWILARMAGG